MVLTLISTSDWATKSRMRDILSPLAPSSSCESVSSAGASGRRTTSSQRPVYTTFLSSTPMSSRASTGQALESKLGYKVLSSIEDGKSAGIVDGGRGEGDVLAGELWEAGYRDEVGHRRVDDDDNDVMGAGSVSARESRADLASSEDYCKFSAGKNASFITESRQDAESVISKGPGEAEDEEISTLKVSHDPIRLRDVQMSYKRYRNPDAGFVLTGLGAAEMSPRGMSGLVSARSTQSEPAKGSRRRSVRSRNNLPSEVSPFPTTVSEDGSSTTRTICSSSVVSSTPRRALSHREPIRRSRDEDRKGSQPLEPIRTALETPDVPRLGLTSDLNDTNRSLFSNERNEPPEDYTTAEQLVRQHPDTRASEGHVSSRAGERDYANKDGRAEEKYFEGMKSEEAGAAELNGDKAQDASNVEMKINSERSCAPEEGSGNLSSKTGMKNDQDAEYTNISGGGSKKIESDAQSVTSRSSSKQSKSSSRRRNYSKPDLETSTGSQSRAGNETTLTFEIERGEDEGRSTELDRGHETAGSSSGTSHREKKKAIERGDDMSETINEEARLTQSARRRGHSQYHTTNKSERGLEREYFTPQANQTEQYVIPDDAEMEDSLVDASELNSRPSSAVSTETSHVSETGSKRKKKSLRRFSKTSHGSVAEKEQAVRPASATSKQDGRGDESHSVASAPQTSICKAKERPEADGEQERPLSATSQMSQKSQMTARSVSSRGSVNGKDKAGKTQTYQVAKTESIGRGLDDISPQVTADLVAEGNTQTPAAATDQSEQLQASNKEDEAEIFGEAKSGMNEEGIEASQKFDPPCAEENEASEHKEARRGSSASAKSASIQGELTTKEQPEKDEGVQSISKPSHSQEAIIEQTPAQTSEHDKENIIGKCEIGEGQQVQKSVTPTNEPESQQKSKTTEAAEILFTSNNVINTEGKQKESPEVENIVAHHLLQSEMPNQSVGGENLEEPPIPSDGHSPVKEDGPSTDIPLQEKAFIDSGDTTEIVKAPVSACVSLEADNTVIDFRPSSASTAKSFTVDHENGAHQTANKDKQRVKSVQPSRIAEVTESEGTPTPGRDTHRAVYTNNEIIQTEYVLPTHEMKSKQAADDGQVLDLAKLVTESQPPVEMEVVHPGMKKRDSKSSIKSKTSASGDHLEDKNHSTVSGEKDEKQPSKTLQNQNPAAVQGERRPSASSATSIDPKNDIERPPSVLSQSSDRIAKSCQRRSSGSSQNSVDKVNTENRPPSAASQRSVDKATERSMSAATQRSADKVTNGERPPSGSSQKSADKVQTIQRPPSVASIQSGDRVKTVERPPSVASQQSTDKVINDERPPLASSQKSTDKVRTSERPPSVASEQSADKAKIDERPPPVTSQRSTDKGNTDERPLSVSSQKSVDKVKYERPPSVASQKSADKVKPDESPPSVASQKSADMVKADERPPSVASQKSADKVITGERPPSVASQKSADMVKAERPPSVASQKSADMLKADERPPSVANQKSIDKINGESTSSTASQKTGKANERPASASSQKSVEKVTMNERSPSFASQKSAEKVETVERPPPASSQTSASEVKVDERPPPASGQKSGDKIKVDQRPQSAASQKSDDQVKVDERPPSAASKKSGDNVQVKRPASVASQRSGDKVQVVERPPSVASQKSGDKVQVVERPPSVASQKSGDKVQVVERPASVASQKSGDKVQVVERSASVASQKSGDKVQVVERPASVASQKSGDKVQVVERPASVASQKSGDKVQVVERPAFVASQKSDEKVQVYERQPSQKSGDNEQVERPPSASSQKSGDKVKVDERPPSVANENSSDKVQVYERPPSVASQKSGDKVQVERPASVASQKSDDKVKVDERPLSAASQKSGEKVQVERPPSASSQKSGDKVKVDERPPSVASQKSGDNVQVERPPSDFSQKSGDNVKVDERPPSVTSQKSGDKVKVDERPASVASLKSGDKVQVDDRSPSVASQKLGDKVQVERPASVASQKSDDKVKVDERPPSVASQKSGDKVKVNERPPSQKSGDNVQVERPPSAFSQKSGDNVKVDERPPSVASQKSGDKVQVDERPPSVTSQKSGDKVKVDERPPSVASQKSGDKVQVDERPPSVTSQKSGDKVKVDERPPSVASQKSGDKVQVDERPPSVASQRSGDKVKVDERPPSVASQRSGDNVQVERPPSASSQKSSAKVTVDERPLSNAS